MDTYLASLLNQQDGLTQTLRVTSLQYLEEALQNEAYEQCAEIIAAAKEAGVVPEEIQYVIQDHIARLKERDRKIVPFRARRP